MTLTLEIRQVYGVSRAYPACDTSRKFAALLNVKTLTREHLRHIEALGYALQVETGAKLEDVA